MGYQTITMKQLDGMLDRGEEIMLIDLRNRASFARGHIRGAVNIPYEELEETACSLPGNLMLVFYCSRGGQSMLACNHMSAKGYRVLNVANGFCSYRGKYLART